MLRLDYETGLVSAQVSWAKFAKSGATKNTKKTWNKHENFEWNWEETRELWASRSFAQGANSREVLVPVSPTPLLPTFLCPILQRRRERKSYVPFASETHHHFSPLFQLLQFKISLCCSLRGAVRRYKAILAELRRPEGPRREAPYL